MDRSDDGLDKINDQRDQPKGKILEPDSGGRERAPTLVYPRAGWGLGRSPVSSLTSNLSVIAASAKLIIGIGIVAILYFGRQVFVPLAVAVLLTFVLAPPVRVLRRWRFGRIPSIVTVVLIAFLALFGLGMVLGEQVTHLAAALPKYQDTLTKKIEGLRGAAAETGTLAQASKVLRNLDQELKEIQPGAEPSATTGRQLTPVPVEIYESTKAPLQVIQRVISPLVDPLVTTGIIIVFVIFFLMQREDLRDRLIRLAGSTDLHRTTVAIDDAGQRLSRYLLAQSALNASFGVTIGVGLALIGVPNPVLWGILAAVLRFVPYIGAIIAAAFPLALAVAVDPGWTTVILTAALFLVVELIVGQVIEPMLYGHSTGISPVAVVVAAMFWTWLWGPIGLLLSTPLTVCLDVLGRHVERLRFLDVLLGSRSALSPAQSFYHRILSGNPDEAFEQAEDMLKTKALSDYYDEVAIEGLRLAELDARRGALDRNSSQKIRVAVEGLVADLSHFDDVTPQTTVIDDEKSAVADASRSTASQSLDLPVLRRDELIGAWASPTAVLCIPGPSPLDEAAAVILAQILEKHGVGVQVKKYQIVSSENIFHLSGDGVALVCLSYIDVGDALARARAAIRRVQRQIPNVTVLVGLWGPNKDEAGTIRSELKASFYAHSLREAAKICIKDARRPRYWAA
jgi:predicted PurR-regulated permease PerM